ncbi:hypothetical protein [Nonomuraea fuscirosea]|nr:hypothetical protein [Nonomuraea fuscirosea]
MLLGAVAAAPFPSPANTIVFFVVWILAAFGPSGYLGRKSKKEADAIAKHEREIVRLYEKLLDVQDPALEERLTIAAHQLVALSAELSELQVMATHRAEVIEQLKQQAHHARLQSESDQNLAAKYQRAAEGMRDYLEVQADDLDSRQRRTQWFFYVLASVTGYAVGLLTTWTYELMSK